MGGHKADYVPARQSGFEVFFGVVGKAGAAAVASTGMHATFDLEKHAFGGDGKIRAPFPDWVKLEFRLHGGSVIEAASGLPQEGEVFFRGAWHAKLSFPKR